MNFYSLLSPIRSVDHYSNTYEVHKNKRSKPNLNAHVKQFICSTENFVLSIKSHYPLKLLSKTTPATSSYMNSRNNIFHCMMQSIKSKILTKLKVQMPTKYPKGLRYPLSSTLFRTFLYTSIWIKGNHSTKKKTLGRNSTTKLMWTPH